jgi:hypothetical protein
MLPTPYINTSVFSTRWIRGWQNAILNVHALLRAVVLLFLLDTACLQRCFSEAAAAHAAGRRPASPTAGLGEACAMVKVPVDGRT